MTIGGNILSKESLEAHVRILEDSEMRFRSLIEQSPMPMEILSLDGKIVRSNPAWRKLWGIDEAVAAKAMKKYNMLTDPQLKKLGVHHLVKMAFSGEHVVLPPIIYDANEAAEDFEIDHIPNLKSPWIQSHLYPIRNESGELIRAGFKIVLE